MYCKADAFEVYSKADVFSVNYDFSPMIPYAAQNLWIQLRWPMSLPIGTRVRLVSIDPNFTPPPKDLRVVDVIGTRVCLETADRSALSRGYGTSVGMKHAPEGGALSPWGYQTRNVSSVGHPDRNWTYGNGRPIAYLVW